MLASHLRMTVGELEQRMDSRELSEWMAWATYFQPLDNSWATTGVLASAIYAPHCKRGNIPKPTDFYPVIKPPQHKLQMQSVLQQMKSDLESK
jgi:hypothetical protein